MSLDLSALIADAKALGQGVLADAKTAGEQLIAAVGGSAEAEVPKLVSDGEQTLVSFIPEPYRDAVLSFASSGTAAVDAAAVTAIKTGVGIALSRLAAI